MIELATEIVAAYVRNNPVPVGELPKLITDTHTAISGLAAAPSMQPEEKPVPAAPIRKSVPPDFLICLEDGKQFKSLKRHLATPEQYRQKWNLPADYPMVAPSYSPSTRKKIGLKFS